MYYDFDLSLINLTYLLTRLSERLYVSNKFQNGRTERAPHDPTKRLTDQKFDIFIIFENPLL